MDLSDEAKRLKKEYSKRYATENKEIINENHKRWRAKNKDKIKEYQNRYWQKKAIEANGVSLESIESRVIELRKNGLSLRKIAIELQINHMKVKRILEQNSEV